ncbi:MAG TPA: hypothetical protein PLF88_02035 [Opitutaceae bacterium]|nr:hypothetical protein [Opitutaceae bacterium]HRJ46895.1 hypothetical protein [Opitutaceae bacterium]
MDVGAVFSTFLGNLTIANITTISARSGAITKRLNKDFYATESETAHSFYAGSYGRNTKIKGSSDLDLVYVLPYETYVLYNSYSTNGQSALLQSVRNSILSLYSSTAIKADGQIIEVSFGDGMKIEVLPAFLNDNGTYTHPNSNDGGKWAVTDPKAEIEAIRKRNDACNKNLIKLARMARAWRSTWAVPISGILVDTLAYQFIENWPYRDKSFLYYDWLSRDFFKWMSEQDESQDWWRAPGSGRYVYGKGLFQYKAKRCYNISVEAIDNAGKSQDWAAKNKWREIYGSSFPD